jgi:HlyD family secretion protein
MTRLLGFPNLLLAMMGALVTGCLSHAADNDLVTEAVTRGTISKTISATGTLNPVSLINVGANVSGTLTEVLVDYNDSIKAGQLLAQIDPLPYQAQVDQSEAALLGAQALLASAEIRQRRDQQLYGKGFLSAAALDESRYGLDGARAKVREAEATLRRDRANLGYTKIRSPVSGVVLSRQVSVGQTVASTFQTPVLFVVAQDLRKMLIEAAVSEADIGQVKDGQLAEFNVDAFPSKSYQGRVRQVRNNFTTLQNVVTYTVVIDTTNEDGLLRPGMTANVRIQVEKRDGVLRVPNAAFRYEPSKGLATSRLAMSTGKGQRLLYRVADGKPAPILVTIGLTDGKMTEAMQSSLEEGDRVVVAERNAGK